MLNEKLKNKIKMINFYELHSEAIRRSSTDAGSVRNPQEVFKWD